MTDEKITVLGAGSWGTALAVHLARKGYNPVLWSHRNEQVEEMIAARENRSYLPDITLPQSVEITGDIESAVLKSTVLISAVPSHAFKEIMTKVVPLTNAGSLMINAAKGIDENTLQRMSEIYAEIEGSRKAEYVILSGPSHAEEVSMAMPTAVVVASKDKNSAVRAQDVLMSGDFRVYTNNDVTGVELGGALKNIIALGTGISDGLGFGDNTKAALMTRGLAEITRLGVSLDANPLTFAGLAGLGDLIVTCTSVHSRNRRAGIEIGKGKTPEGALASVRMVVEGFRTTRAAYRLSAKKGVDMPITRQIYGVLYEGANPVEAVEALMGRGKRNEMEYSINSI
ncbi:MAG: NAD(P)H-dependent glycerol-3-phosphate dehydrogenase [Bacillota bacterium]